MRAKRYETIYIVVPDLTDDDYKSIQTWAKNIIQNQGGLVAQVEDWGKKKLAYPIRKKVKGAYTLLNYFGNQQAVSELERHFRIKEDILRFLTIKLEDEAEVDEAEYAEEEEAEVETAAGTEKSGEVGASTAEETEKPAVPVEVEAKTEESPETVAETEAGGTDEGDAPPAKTEDEAAEAPMAETEEAK